MSTVPSIHTSISPSRTSQVQTCPGSQVLWVRCGMGGTHAALCPGFAYGGTSFPPSGSAIAAVLAGALARRINATCTLEISLKLIF